MRMILRRHYPLLIALLVVMGGLLFGLGTVRIQAYTVSGALQVTAQPAVGGYDISGDVALFDDSVVHSIQLLMDEADYQEMITTYQVTGEKEYFHADIVIDGVKIADVGVRLRGNASLRTALGGALAGQRPGAMLDRLGQGMGNPPDPENLPNLQNMPVPENLPRGFNPGDGQSPPALPNMPNQPGAQGNRMDGPFGAASTDTTVKIPLQIKFDEFVSGQSYQGYTRFAIRTYGTSGDAAMLQEPVTNAMASLAGLPVTQAAYTGFRLNDGEELLYTISELIDESYLEKHFEYSDGVLFKAEVGSTMSYQGEDPTVYDNSFSQQTRNGEADMAGLIDFIRFVNSADDETFAAELPERFDVASFAAYLALNNLLVNYDAIVGMNNNYYLYFDDQTGLVTLLMWDGNESLGRLGGGGTAAATYDLYYTNTGQPMMGPRMGGENQLATRFLETPAFKALYEEKLAEIYRTVFLSGAIVAQVNEYANLVLQVNPERSLVVEENYNTAVQNILDFLAGRSEYLASTALLGQVEP